MTDSTATVAEVGPAPGHRPRVPVRPARRPPGAARRSSIVVAVVLLAPLVFLLIEAHGAGRATQCPPHLPAPDGHPAVEHGPADRGGDRAVRHHRHPGGLVRRAHRPARPAHLGGAGRGALRHPRLRRELRLGVADHLGPGLPGRGAGHDPRPSTRSSTCRWRPACAAPTPARRRSPAASGSAGSGPSSGSRWARPGAPSSVAACWWPWSCWPSTAPSRSSATRPSPPRSSPSSRSRSTSRPPGRSPWCWWSSAWWSSVGDVVARGRGRVARTGPLAQRAIRRHRLGRATVPVLVGFAALVRAGPRRADRVQRLLDVRGRRPLPHRRLPPGRRLAHRALQRGGRGPGHPDGPAGGPAGRPPRRARRPAARAQHLPGAGHARPGHRPRPELLRRALRRRVRLPDRARC